MGAARHGRNWAAEGLLVGVLVWTFVLLAHPLAHGHGADEASEGLHCAVCASLGTGQVTAPVACPQPVPLSTRVAALSDLPRLPHPCLEQPSLRSPPTSVAA